MGLVSYGRRPMRRHLTYANLMSTLAVFLVVGGGAAYAANTVFSTDIVNGEVKTQDLAADAVTSPKILDGGVKVTDINDGAVTNAKIRDGAVTNFKLGSGVVTHSKLGPDSIDGSNVAANSLTLSDILGADKSASISFSLGANACGNLSFAVPGAQVGQVVLFSFTGSTAVPTTVVFGGVRVTAANTVVVRACNVGASAMSVSNLGVRIVTFG
jgi:hypothetical protein